MFALCSHTCIWKIDEAGLLARRMGREEGLPWRRECMSLGEEGTQQEQQHQHMGGFDVAVLYP